MPNISLTEEEADTKNAIMTDVTTYVDEMVLRFIVGTESLDNWDSYVATVESMNLAGAIEAMQTAYDRYMAVTVAD